jgi:hypothetical protein
MHTQTTKINIFIFVLCIGFSACEKDPSLAPQIDQGAVINLVAPTDSFYYLKSSDITVKAAISGKLTDYSFLQFSVLNADTKDTLKSGQTPANGTIEVSWSNELPPGEYKIEIVAFNPNDKNEVIRSYARLIFICIPPPLQIVAFSKDDSSISISWNKSMINDFKAYELFVTRTDTARDRPPFPEGKKIATITNINTTSFKDTGVFFYYKYEYVIKVISQEDCSSNSQAAGIQAGSFMELQGSPTQVGKRIFDKSRNRLYYQGATTSTRSNLYIINPELLTLEKAVFINEDVVYINLQANNNKLNLIKKLSNINYQLMTMDLNSFNIQNEEQFSLPSGVSVEGVAGKLILFKGVYEVYLHNITTGVNSLIKWASLPSINIVDNHSKFIISSYPDSVFVYTFNSTPQLLASRQVPHSSPAIEVHYSENNVVAVHGQLFDSSFNFIRMLAFPEYFIGLSADGQYAISNKNNIYSSLTGEIVSKYGDGFGTEAFFSSDNKTLYHITAGSLNIKWNPMPRLFRYPWQ